MSRSPCALVAQDATGNWFGPPVGVRAVLTGRLRAAYEVDLDRRPMILGFQLDGARTAHVLVSFWIEDPVRVVVAGSAVSHMLLRESIVAAVGAALAGGAQVDPVPLVRSATIASVGGVCWELIRVSIGADVTGACGPLHPGGLPLRPSPRSSPESSSPRTQHAPESPVSSAAEWRDLSP